MMFEGQSKLCLVEKKKERKRRDENQSEELSIKSKDYKKVVRIKSFFLS